MTEYVRTIDPAAMEMYAPFIPWDQFLARFSWAQGEHIGMIGTTGSGKTSLALPLLGLRRYVTVFGTKPEDETLDRFAAAKGYKKISKWNPRMKADKVPRRILWPDASSLYASPIQRQAFQEALSSIFAQGGWCVYMDELWWMDKKLKMGEEIKTFLQQGRSVKLSLVAATQRPAWIPLEIYDQSTHLFFWLDNDEANLNRISGIGYRSANLIREIVSSLPLHEVLYVNTRKGTMCRTMAPDPNVTPITESSN